MNLPVGPDALGGTRVIGGPREHQNGAVPFAQVLAQSPRMPVASKSPRSVVANGSPR